MVESIVKDMMERILPYADDSHRTLLDSIGLSGISSMADFVLGVALGEAYSQSCAALIVIKDRSLEQEEINEVLDIIKQHISVKARTLTSQKPRSTKISLPVR